MERTLRSTRSDAEGRGAPYGPPVDCKDAPAAPLLEVVRFCHAARSSLRADGRDPGVRIMPIERRD